LPGKTEENHKKTSVWISSVQAEIQNKNLQNTESRALPLDHTVWLILYCFQVNVLEPFNYRIIMHPEDFPGQQAIYKRQFQEYRTHSNILLYTVQARSYQIQSLFIFFILKRYKIATVIHKLASPERFRPIKKSK
jgi:hypothetical protein